MKNIFAPSVANRTRLCVSKISKSIKSKIQQNQLFVPETSGHFPKCVKLGMHFWILISELDALRVGLVFILPDCNYFLLIHNDGNVLFLSLHSHGKGLCNRDVYFTDLFYIQINPPSTSAAKTRSSRSSTESRCLYSGSHHTAASSRPEVQR